MSDYRRAYRRDMAFFLAGAFCAFAAWILAGCPGLEPR